MDNNFRFWEWSHMRWIEGLMGTVRGSSTVIMVPFGPEDRFLPGIEFMYKVSSFRTGNNEDLSRCVTHQVIPKMPPNSVVAMGNAPYRSKVHYKRLRKYTKKPGMVS